MDPKQLYDVVIIGGGPAGLTAGLYLARAKYRVLIVEKAAFGGQITITDQVVNYPGVLHTSGRELTETMRQQAQSFGAEFLLAEVTGLSLDDTVKTVKTDRGDLSCFGVLWATGAHPRMVGFPGEEAFRGRGVAYCAICDGEFFTGRDVFVVGGGFAAAEAALAGARDIVAELVAEDPENTADLREYTHKTAAIESEAIDADEKTPYEPYYEFSEAARSIPNHRILAIDRGEREGKLRVRVGVDTQAAVTRLGSRWPRRQGPFAPVLDAAIADGYKRLMAPSLERELRAKLTVRAQTDAIKVFGKNLESLLSARPVRGARVIALDPGFRTGCKVAVLDETGKLLDHGVVYPTKPRHDVAGTKRELARLVKKHHINTIVIGNGTASRETEEVVSEFIAEQAPDLRYTIVNEAGASVYSASELASAEYPELDVTTRGAMSLGRRLQDPLAELVKIPPQSIGVGQYQHDLDQAELSRTLGNVVEDVVNRVGVDVNTASASLLGYVSGITQPVAKNIVAYREENGVFTDRNQLKKVPKLGPKAFEQCAGFLRISGGKNPLDATSVHPESYAVATQVLERAGVTAADLAAGGIPDIDKRVGNVATLAGELGCGFMTLIDIVDELKKPGRDPRDDAPEVVFSRAALSIDDLQPGMELTGTVRNVVDFGAFVDVGVHQDGLVHISKLAKRFVKHPSDVVAVGDTVKVWVEKVDRDRGKISLTMVQGK